MVFNAFTRIRNLDLGRKNSSTLISPGDNPLQIEGRIRHPLQSLELVDLHFFYKSHPLARHVKFIKLEEHPFDDLVGLSLDQLLFLRSVYLDAVLLNLLGHNVPVEEFGRRVVLGLQSQELGVEGSLGARLLLGDGLSKGQHEGGHDLAILIGF